MNREILFKGKRVSNGEWVEGYIVKRPTGEWQIERRCDNPPDGDPMWKKVLITYEVKPDTICQYTGLKDKNGNKIWENDIVTVPEDEEPCLIGWDEYCARWEMTQYASHMYDFDNFAGVELEVLGNIFDNPDLLEGGA